MRTGELGFWWRSLGGPPPARAPLAGSTEADVAIVGAGYTGLWTAYYLKLAEPSLRVVMLEREFSGFGASGRNGGWVSGFFSGPARVYERRGGRAGVVALQRAMFATVDEVGRVIADQGIDADFVKGGHVAVALNVAQAQRMRDALERSHDSGLSRHDLRELDRRELDDRVRVSGASCATFSPHVARVHPAKLVSAWQRSSSVSALRSTRPRP